MGLYPEDEAWSPYFPLFLQDTCRDFTVRTQDLMFWRTIANYLCDSKDAQESYKQSPTHRFLHHLITFSINHKRHDDKVPTKNLFLSLEHYHTGCVLQCPIRVSEFLAWKSG